MDRIGISKIFIVCYTKNGAQQVKETLLMIKVNHEMQQGG